MVRDFNDSDCNNRTILGTVTIINREPIEKR